jgi:hypothetical protein
MKTLFLISAITLLSISSNVQADSLTSNHKIEQLNIKVKILENNIDSIIFYNNVSFSLFDITLNEITFKNKQLQKRINSTIKHQSELMKNYEQMLFDFDNYKTQSINKIDSIYNVISTNNINIGKTTSELGLRISTSEANTSHKITTVVQSIWNNSLYGFIVILLAILVFILLFWLTRKRQKTDKLDIFKQLSKTKVSIEESLVKEFGKQTELMATQLQIIEQKNKSSILTLNEEPDHSLALKVASEISLIERNISLMDAGTRGLIQLSHSVNTLKDNLSANGYDMPELLGKSFNEGMIVIVVNSIPDDTLEIEKEIITKVLIPQVNYNNKMIQTAHIEVSVGC